MMRDIFDIRDNFALYIDTKSHLIYGNYAKCKNPKISILMPVYSNPNLFERAFKSVVNQDCKFEYEVIVIDNNSLLTGSNIYQQIIEENNLDNVYYHRNDKNIGGYSNLNRCIEMARAPYVTLCHDDTTLLPDALSTLMKLQKGEKAVFSASNGIDEHGNFFYKNSYPQRKKKIFIQRPWYKYNIFDQFISPATIGVGALFSRRCLLELGGLDMEFAPSSDYALFSVYTYRYGSIYNNIATWNYYYGYNASMQEYIKFIDVDRHFRKSMKEKLPLPNRFLDRIIMANYNVSKVNLEIFFGKKDKSLYNTLDIKDRIIMKIVNTLLNIKKYRLMNINQIFQYNFIRQKKG